MIKKVLNFILVSYYSIKKNLIISNKFLVSFRTARNCGYGCKFLDNVSISKNVEIGRFTSINGPATRIASHINKVKIGNFCSIASNVVIQEYYHKYDRITSYYINQNIFNSSVENDIFSKGDITIEDDVWIGSNSVILSGITIGRGSIIGAGSVVIKDIPKYSIVGGNPARVIKSRFSNEIIDYLENLKWWEWDVHKINSNKELFNLTENQLFNKMEARL